MGANRSSIPEIAKTFSWRVNQTRYNPPICVKIAKCPASTVYPSSLPEEIFTSQ
ncbi:hypothetical protein Hanom_Chr16g01444391 [Helianthus anomalus]